MNIIWNITKSPTTRVKLFLERFKNVRDDIPVSNAAGNTDNLLPWRSTCRDVMLTEDSQVVFGGFSEMTFPCRMQQATSR